MSLIPPDPAKDSAPLSKTQACIPEHCYYAFDSLYCALSPSATPIAPTFVDDPYPLFITWNTRSSRSGRSRLRGCIGTFEPQPLYEGLADYALTSAFRDSRFRKIDRSELQNLECCVSLLTDFEDADSYLDWTIGVHGIHISFPHPSLLNSSSSSSTTPSPLSSSSYLPRLTRKQNFTATYLPEVIPEQGWDKVEAVDSAIQKAGWNGTITEDIRRSVKLRRYQSSQCVIDWDDYLSWRKEHEAKAKA
ncbi:hypothetical protein E1B28_004092 [Marasmius oreades]|uniref:AMMECR1 domain-containing protein n=1 Tax=Marasmius oreades TaxID=181124 RepID=A0A9P7UY34_9AGAR|nr:uncharacterized protein E1B28_004092 [Marasmius oreades]KAG7096678.1 hypothetical protein E1B28_004092 [Marasmius oreades]